METKVQAIIWACVQYLLSLSCHVNMRNFAQCGNAMESWKIVELVACFKNKWFAEFAQRGKECVQRSWACGSINEYVNFVDFELHWGHHGEPVMVFSWSPTWADASLVEDYSVLKNKFPIVFIPKKHSQFMPAVLEIVVELWGPLLGKFCFWAMICCQRLSAIGFLFAVAIKWVFARLERLNALILAGDLNGCLHAMKRYAQGVFVQHHGSSRIHVMLYSLGLASGRTGSNGRW